MLSPRTRLSARHATLVAAVALSVSVPALHAADPAPAPAKPAATPAPAPKPAAEPAKKPEPAKAAAPAPKKDREGDAGRPPEGVTTFSPSQIDEALQLLQDIDPELATKITDLRTKNPERVAATLLQHFPRLAPLILLKKSDPELFKLKIEDMKLDRETKDTVKQLRAAGKDEAKARDIRIRIQEMVTRQFYVRQEIREHELATLEKRVGELRDQIEARKDAREKLIQERITQLTGKEEAAEW